MSSLVRSFASFYCQKLRSTTRLGPVTAAPSRFQELNRRGFSGSSGAADARRSPALPMPSQQSQEKWASLLRIQGEVEMVKDTAEAVAEVVEMAATAAEKASSEVAEQLPEKGRLRAVAVLVEHASKEVAEEAHLAQDILHKVDEIEEDMKAIMDHGKHAAPAKARAHD
uniref:Uncharacterized protein n=1 Tax=Sorghum bicolor TaxID=4558 RepID=C6JRS2_SORBI